MCLHFPYQCIARLLYILYLFIFLAKIILSAIALCCILLYCIILNIQLQSKCKTLETYFKYVKISYMIINYLCDISGIRRRQHILNYTYTVFCGVFLCKLDYMPLLLTSRYTGHLSHIPHKGFYWLAMIGEQIFEWSKVIHCYKKTHERINDLRNRQLSQKRNVSQNIFLKLMSSSCIIDFVKCFTILP